MPIVLVVTVLTGLAAAEPWPSGEFAEGGVPDAEAPAGYLSKPFTVTGDGLRDGVAGWLAVGAPAPEAAGPGPVLVAFTGGSGTAYWSVEHEGTAEMGGQLRSRGWTVVQVRWARLWWNSLPGEDTGIAHLAAAPATVLRWVHEEFCAPADLPLFITGNSAGSAQCAYALSHYGLDRLVDKAVLSGGPPFAALAKTCMVDLRDSPYGLNTPKLRQIDGAHGFRGGGGPAERHDPAWVPRWTGEAVATGGDDYHHPDTEIHFIIGDRDRRMAAIAGDYRDRLSAEPENDVTWTVVPRTRHDVYETPAGRAAVLAALTGRRGQTE